MVNRKEFATVALDLTKEFFVGHVAYFRGKMLIYPAWKAQIVLLVVKKVAIPAKYSDYTNVFSKESAAKLPECSDINEHTIDLELDK